MNECVENRLALAEDFQACRDLILALGSESRQQIILALLESEQVGLRVGEITAKTHLSRPAVSHHLRILKDAGVITVRSCGTMNFYYMDTNEEEWGKLAALTTRIQVIMRKARAAGYPPTEEELDGWNSSAKTEGVNGSWN